MPGDKRVHSWPHHCHLLPVTTNEISAAASRVVEAEVDGRTKEPHEQHLLLRASVARVVRHARRRHRMPRGLRPSASHHHLPSFGRPPNCDLASASAILGDRSLTCSVTFQSRHTRTTGSFSPRSWSRRDWLPSPARASSAWRPRSGCWPSGTRRRRAYRGRE